jgi:chaperonin GroEL
VALLRAATALHALAPGGDQQLDVRIVQRHRRAAALGLARMQAASAEVVVDQVKRMEGDRGFNAQSPRYENLIQAGVIDPTKVVRVALQNTTSVASLLLTTQAAIS